MGSRQGLSVQNAVGAVVEEPKAPTDILPDTKAGPRRDVAEYIAEMILELRNLARSQKLFTVMVPLEYAYYEAFTAANKVEIPEAELKRIEELSKFSANLEQGLG